MRGSRGDHAAVRALGAAQGEGTARPGHLEAGGNTGPLLPPAGQAEGPPCPPTARSEGRSHGGRAEAAATPHRPGSLPPAQGPRSTPEF